MAYVIGVFALASSIAVFAPITLGTELFASGPGETRLAFTSSVDGVACCIIMTVTLVRTIGTERPWWAW